MLLWPKNQHGRWMEYDIAAIVQRWMDTLSPSSVAYGVLLRATGTTGDVKMFYSSEHSDASLRPKVEITYAVRTPLVTHEQRLADGSPRHLTMGPVGTPVAKGSFGYTIRGWASGIRYTDGANAEKYDALYEFLADGNVLEQDVHNPAIRSGRVVTAYRYDGLDRLRQAQATGGASYTGTYAYDRNGNITAQTGPGGRSLTYGYRTSQQRHNRMLSLSGSASRTYVHDRNGNVTQDGKRVLTYDYRGQVASVTAGTTPTEHYLYDASGQRVRSSSTEALFSDSFSDGLTTGWYINNGWSESGGTYKASPTTTGNTAVYPATFTDFEAEFQMKINTVPDPVYFIGLQFRKLQRYHNNSQSGYIAFLRANGEVGLEKAGVMLSSASTGLSPQGVWRTMKVTAYGGLITVSVDGTEYIRYTDASPVLSGYVGFRAYDLSGEVDDLAVTKTQSVYYVRGAAGEVLAEYDHAGALQAEYAYGGGQRIAVLKPSGSGKEVSYYFNDHLGSARVLWSGTSAKWASDYYAYGEVEAQSGQEGESRFGFTGHETDFASDLIYAGARYYDAEVGRWLQVDPKAAQGPGWSPYNYTFNNPLKYTDPTGEWPTPWDVADWGFAALSVKDFVSNPSWSNAGWAAYDIVAAAAPIIPTSGIFRHGMRLIAGSDEAMEIVKGADKLQDLGRSVGNIKGVGDRVAADQFRAIDNTLADQLDATTLSGALKEKNGVQILHPKTGKPMDHLGKVNGALQGLQTRVKTLEGRLGDRRLSADDRKIIQQKIGAVNEQIDRTREFINQSIQR